MMNRRGRTMSNLPSDAIRRAVLDELARRGWSKYRLAEELGGGRRNHSLVYRWLSGGRGVDSANLARVLDVLGLYIAPKRGRKEKQMITDMSAAESWKKITRRAADDIIRYGRMFFDAVRPERAVPLAEVKDGNGPPEANPNPRAWVWVKGGKIYCGSRSTTTERLCNVREFTGWDDIQFVQPGEASYYRIVSPMYPWD